MLRGRPIVRANLTEQRDAALPRARGKTIRQEYEIEARWGSQRPGTAVQKKDGEQMAHQLAPKKRTRVSTFASNCATRWAVSGQSAQ